MTCPWRPEARKQALRFASVPGAEWSKSKSRQLWPRLLQAPFHGPHPGDPLESVFYPWRTTNNRTLAELGRGSLSARLLSAGRSSLV